MSKFYLEKPSLKRKKDILDYLNEHVIYHSKINGTGSLDHILEGSSFEESLTRCLNLENEEYAKKEERTPSKTFLLIREYDNKLIGMINIRTKLSKKYQKFGGNIGYGIRPTERRKGYNKINLYLGLLEIQKLGLNNIKISCNVDNLGSNKTLKSYGGILELTAIDPYDNELTNVYSFNVKDTLNKYHDTYSKYI